jgi:hypothetical protein
MNTTEELEATLDDIVRRSRLHLDRLRDDFGIYKAGAVALQEVQRRRARHRPYPSFEEWVRDLVTGNVGR